MVPVLKEANYRVKGEETGFCMIESRGSYSPHSVIRKVWEGLGRFGKILKNI